MYCANSQAWRWFYNGLKLFYEERSLKIVHFGSHDESLLLSANIGREFVTTSTATRTWDELGIYA